MDTNTNENKATALANTEPQKEYTKQPEQQDEKNLEDQEAGDSASELVHGKDSALRAGEGSDEGDHTQPISPLKTVRDDMELRRHDMEDEKE